ncbi:MAG: MerR family transcriptional regulator [Pseudomonadota bacterium]
MVQSQAATSLTVGQLAAAANVGVETIRFYQRTGLLAVPDKSGGIRRYGAEDLRNLRFIRMAQTAGFTLAEIKELLELDSSQDHQRARDLANARIAELDVKIDELQRARVMLKRLATECSRRGSTQPCAILAAFKI